MVADSNQAPIIIKKVKKGGHGGHHGGAWKVAYADFVTAMMAFFLLLWLLNATTEEQRVGISNYFAPGSVTKTASGAGGVLGGLSMNSEGPMRSSSSPVSVQIQLPPASEQGSEEAGDAEATSIEEAEMATRTLEDEEITERQKEEIVREREEQEFAKAEEELRQAIESVPELSQLADNLIIDRTPEGMRIQIVDQDRLSMFPSGSAVMHEYTRHLLYKVAEVVRRMDNRIAISGHTDATPYADHSGYSNWELSTDRANASRRVLLEAGLPEDRIARVAGRAEKDPLISEDPFDPRNRRISIVLLHRQDDHTSPE